MMYGGRGVKECESEGEEVDRLRAIRPHELSDSDEFTYHPTTNHPSYHQKKPLKSDSDYSGINDDKWKHDKFDPDDVSTKSSNTRSIASSKFNTRNNEPKPTTWIDESIPNAWDTPVTDPDAWMKSSSGFTTSTYTNDPPKSGYLAEKNRVIHSPNPEKKYDLKISQERKLGHSRTASSVGASSTTSNNKPQSNAWVGENAGTSDWDTPIADPDAWMKGPNANPPSQANFNTQPTQDARPLVPSKPASVASNPVKEPVKIAAIKPASANTWIDENAVTEWDTPVEDPDAWMKSSPGFTSDMVNRQAPVKPQANYTKPPPPQDTRRSESVASSIHSDAHKPSTKEAPRKPASVASKPFEEPIKNAATKPAPANSWIDENAVTEWDTPVEDPDAWMKSSPGFIQDMKSNPTPVNSQANYSKPLPSQDTRRSESVASSIHSNSHKSSTKEVPSKPASVAAKPVEEPVRNAAPKTALANKWIDENATSEWDAPVEDPDAWMKGSEGYTPDMKSISAPVKPHANYSTPPQVISRSASVASSVQAESCKPSAKEVPSKPASVASKAVEEPVRNAAPKTALANNWIDENATSEWDTPVEDPDAWMKSSPGFTPDMKSNSATVKAQANSITPQPQIINKSASVASSVHTDSHKPIIKEAPSKPASVASNPVEVPVKNSVCKPAPANTWIDENAISEWDAPVEDPDAWMKSSPGFTPDMKSNPAPVHSLANYSKPLPLQDTRRSGSVASSIYSISHKSSTKEAPSKPASVASNPVEDPVKNSVCKPAPANTWIDENATSEWDTHVEDPDAWMKSSPGFTPDMKSNSAPVKAQASYITPPQVINKSAGVTSSIHSISHKPSTKEVPSKPASVASNPVEEPVRNAVCKPQVNSWADENVVSEWDTPVEDPDAWMKSSPGFTPDMKSNAAPVNSQANYSKPLPPQDTRRSESVALSIHSISHKSSTKEVPSKPASVASNPVEEPVRNVVCKPAPANTWIDENAISEWDAPVEDPDAWMKGSEGYTPDIKSNPAPVKPLANFNTSSPQDVSCGSFASSVHSDSHKPYTSSKPASVASNPVEPVRNAVCKPQSNSWADERAVNEWDTPIDSPDARMKDSGGCTPVMKNNRSQSNFNKSSPPVVIFGSVVSPVYGDSYKPASAAAEVPATVSVDSSIHSDSHKVSTKAIPNKPASVASEPVEGPFINSVCKPQANTWVDENAVSEWDTPVEDPDAWMKSSPGFTPDMKNNRPSPVQSNSNKPHSQEIRSVVSSVSSDSHKASKPVPTKPASVSPNPIEEAAASHRISANTWIDENATSEWDTPVEDPDAWMKGSDGYTPDMKNNRPSPVQSNFNKPHSQEIRSVISFVSSDSHKASKPVPTKPASVAPNPIEEPAASHRASANTWIDENATSEWDTPVDDPDAWMKGLDGYLPEMKNNRPALPSQNNFNKLPPVIRTASVASPVHSDSHKASKPVPSNPASVSSNQDKDLASECFTSVADRNASMNPSSEYSSTHLSRAIHTHNPTPQVDRVENMTPLKTTAKPAPSRSSSTGTQKRTVKAWDDDDYFSRSGRSSSLRSSSPKQGYPVGTNIDSRPARAPAIRDFNARAGNNWNSKPSQSNSWESDQGVVTNEWDTPIDNPNAWMGSSSGEVKNGQYDDVKKIATSVRSVSPKPASKSQAVPPQSNHVKQTPGTPTDNWGSNQAASEWDTPVDDPDAWMKSSPVFTPEMNNILPPVLSNLSARTESPKPCLKPLPTPPSSYSARTPSAGSCDSKAPSSHNGDVSSAPSNTWGDENVVSEWDTPVEDPNAWMKSSPGFTSDMGNRQAPVHSPLPSARNPQPVCSPLPSARNPPPVATGASRPPSVASSRNSKPPEELINNPVPSAPVKEIPGNAWIDENSVSEWDTPVDDPDAWMESSPGFTPGMKSTHRNPPAETAGSNTFSQDIRSGSSVHSDSPNAARSKHESVASNQCGDAKPVEEPVNDWSSKPAAPSSKSDIAQQGLDAKSVKIVNDFSSKSDSNQTPANTWVEENAASEWDAPVDDPNAWMKSSPGFTPDMGNNLSRQAPPSARNLPPPSNLHTIEDVEEPTPSYIIEMRKEQARPPPNSALFETPKNTSSSKPSYEPANPPQNSVIESSVPSYIIEMQKEQAKTQPSCLPSAVPKYCRETLVQLPEPPASNWVDENSNSALATPVEDPNASMKSSDGYTPDVGNKKPSALACSNSCSSNFEHAPAVEHIFPRSKSSVTPVNTWDSQEPVGGSGCYTESAAPNSWINPNPNPEKYRTVTASPVSPVVKPPVRIPTGFTPPYSPVDKTAYHKSHKKNISTHDLPPAFVPQQHLPQEYYPGDPINQPLDMNQYLEGVGYFQNSFHPDVSGYMDYDINLYAQTYGLPQPSLLAAGPVVMSPTGYMFPADLSYMYSQPYPQPFYHQPQFPYHQPYVTGGIQTTYYEAPQQVPPCNNVTSGITKRGGSLKFATPDGKPLDFTSIKKGNELKRSY